MTLLIEKDPTRDWTFKEIKTQEFTHGLHQYPARMHPEIAKRLIAKFTSKKSERTSYLFVNYRDILKSETLITL